MTELRQRWEREKAELRSSGKAEGRAEGKVEGKAEGKAEAVLAVLKARGSRSARPCARASSDVTT